MSAEDEKLNLSEPVLHNLEEIQADWLLEELVDITNGTENEIGLTLNIGGILLTGTLISGHKYFEWFANTIGSGSEETTKYFKSFGEVYLKKKDNKSKPPALIHIKDAKFYQPGGNISIPAVDGSYWRGRITVVDGFILGKLHTGKN